MTHTPSAPSVHPLHGKRLVLAGGSGFVGQALRAHLEGLGCEVHQLVREASPDVPARAPDAQPRRHPFRPGGALVAPEVLEGAAGLVHLGGVSVAAGRWTPSLRKQILESRVLSTRTLVDSLLALGKSAPPFVCASAVGYYGYRGAEALDETSPPGDTFLAEVCQAWEAEARRASPVTRSVQLRLGTVFGPGGGALAELAPLFRAGLGGPLGSGRQFMSWIALADVVEALVLCVTDSTLESAVNATSPGAVTNRDFTRALGAAVGRPAVLRVPAFALRLAVGEFADELLHGQRAEPRRLTERGFGFQYANLADALRASL